MGSFLMAFYVVFFATGFMGGAALVLLGVRLGGGRVLRPLLALQGLFLLGMGLILLYFAVPVPPAQALSTMHVVLLGSINAVNAAVWVFVIVLIDRAAPPGDRLNRVSKLAELLAASVALKSVANVVVTLAAPQLAAAGAWSLVGHILSATAMAALGIALFSNPAPPEKPRLLPLLRAYGILAIIFAPIGLIEYAIESARIPWLASISLDHVFYLAWNVVSMSVALRLFKAEDVRGEPPAPEERARSLGLSDREAEIAVLIGRGLTNKEIASHLCISSATVRTHVYNLYRKVGAGNRVDLVNVLRD